MFLHIMGNELRGRLIISHMLIYFPTQLYYDIISLISLKSYRRFIYYLVLQKIKASFGILKSKITFG